MSHTADDTRHRLLEAAGEVFAEKGFQAATVREICSRADANLAAVNYHFGDKERLYIEAVRHAHCDEAEEPPADWPPGTPPAVKLRDYIRGVLDKMLNERRPAWHARLLVRELTEPTRACEALVEDFIRSRHDLLDAILRELLPPETSAADRHLIGFSIVGQCMHFNRLHKAVAVLLVGEEEYRTYDVERLTEHITRFSLAALGHEAAAAVRRGTEAASG